MYTEATEIPERLRATQEVVRRLLPENLFDRGTWVHWDRLGYISAAYAISREPPQTMQQDLLRHAQDLLAPFADSEDCRSKRRKWRNTSYCPDAPYGGYLWKFHVEMIQQLLWMYPEFVSGFRFWEIPDVHRSIRGDRDANPYTERSRSRSWDLGYILGLAWHHEGAKMQAWVDARRPPVPPASDEGVIALLNRP